MVKRKGHLSWARVTIRSPLGFGTSSWVEADIMPAARPTCTDMGLETRSHRARVMVGARMTPTKLLYLPIYT